MFWGLIMEPGRCYTQKVKVSFHISMAALDISNSGDEPAQVMCVFEGRNYLLCTLNKKDKIQCALDLNFEFGTKVSFATNGKAHVHLTGYLTTLDESDIEDESNEEEEVEEEEEVQKKRLKRPVTEGPPNKKSKVNIEEQEEESSDSDFDVEKELELGHKKKDDSEEEEEEEDEDSSSLSNEEDDESEEEEEEEEEVKPKQNGVGKANKKNKEPKLQEKSPKEKSKKLEKKAEPEQKLKKSVLKGGVIAQDLKEGTGETVKEGKFIHVYYEGHLKDNNKVFDATTKGPGFSFRVGKGEVIKAWDIGVVGMKVGGKRRLTCPPKVAYGHKGSPPVIPPNAVLVFDVEVKKIS